MSKVDGPRSWKLTPEQHARCSRAMHEEIARWVAEGRRPPRIALPEPQAEVLSSVELVLSRIALDESTRDFLVRLVEVCRPHGGATVAVLEEVLAKIGVRPERVSIKQLGLETDSLLVGKTEDVVVPAGVSPCAQDMRRRIEYYVKRTVLPRIAEDFNRGVFPARVLLFARKSLATGEAFGGVRALEVASWSRTISAPFMVKVTETGRLVDSVGTAFAVALSEAGKAPRGLMAAVHYAAAFQAETIPVWHAKVSDGQLLEFVEKRLPKDEVHADAATRMRGAVS